LKPTGRSAAFTFFLHRRERFYPRFYGDLSILLLSRFFNGALELTMGILSIQALPAASAAQRGYAKGFVAKHPAACRSASTHFELISVVIASKDARQARHALLACPDTAVVRCLPMSTHARVKLEIRFPAGQGDAVINRIVASVPNGQIGGIVACTSANSWTAH
jgi:hypothetical protein